MLVDQATRILVQGITGREAATMTRDMIAYGSKVVAGVTPGKGGEQVAGVPVFDTVAEAVRDCAPEASVVSVPPRLAKDAVMEAAANRIRLCVVLTERIPRRDVVEMVAFADAYGMRIIGPNSPGVISPGKAKLGFLGGNNPERAFRPGCVGVISRSGGMCTEVANLIGGSGLGVSTAIGMGGDPIVGSTYLDLFPLFWADSETAAVALFCEPGGQKEEALAEWLGANLRKPVVAFIGGRFVDTMPGTRFGHASVIVRAGRGSACEKADALRAAGVKVVESYAEIPAALREGLQASPN